MESWKDVILPPRTIDKETEAERGPLGKYHKERKPGFKARAFCVDAAQIRKGATEIRGRINSISTSYPVSTPSPQTKGMGLHGAATL